MNSLIDWTETYHTYTRHLMVQIDENPRSIAFAI